MNAQWRKLGEQVIEHLRGTARFRWWALLAAWAICLIGWTAIAMQRNIFFADARVYVDTRTSLAPVLQGITITQDINAQLNLVAQSLLGRVQLEKLATDVGLDRDADTPEEKDRVISQIRERVSLNAAGVGGGGTVYTIGYASYDRETSLHVVDYLLNTFVSDTLGGKRENQEVTQSFLREQIKEYELRLREDEQRLADFKRRNVGQMPGAQGDYFTRLQVEMQEEDKLRGQLAVAVSRRDELNRQLRGGQELTDPSILGMVPDNPTDIAIKEAEARLQEYLLRYTEKHPDVQIARETLAQLQLRRSRELEALGRGPSLASGASTNPVVQRIQLALNEAEVDIAALRNELAAKERSVAQLRSLVNVVPEVESELLGLNRTYEFTRSQYNELVARLDKANLGQEAESTESIKFEVVNPPSAAFKPVKPNRPLLMSAVLVLALAAGAALAFVLHMLKPVFHSSRALQDATGVPVLGVVSMTWLDRYRRHQMRSYAAFVVGLIGLVAVLAIYLKAQYLMPFSLASLSARLPWA